MNVESVGRRIREIVLSRLALCAFVTSIGAALTMTGCSTLTGPNLAQREFTWGMSHGGCECGPAAFPPGNAGASGEYARESDMYVHNFVKQCRQRQILVVAYGDGVPDVVADMKLARARATRLVRGLSGKRPWTIDAIWFGGPHVLHASTAHAMCLNQPIPQALRASAT